MFWKNIVTLITGNTIGQAIALVSMPLLTRMYSPAQFSTMALLIAISSILSVFATMRYEVAIVLPEKDSNALELVGLAFLMALVFSIVLMGVISIFWAELYRLFSITQTGRWIFLIPVMVLLMSLYSILTMWSNRNKKFRRISSSVMGLQGGYAIIAMSIGGLSSSFNGLIIGRAISQLIAAYILLRRNLFALYSAVKENFINRNWFQTAIDFRQFPLFNFPYSLLGTMSREAIILIFTMTGSLAAAGMYVLARTIIYAPVGLLSASIGHVFYREAALEINNAGFQQRAKNMLFSIVLVVLPGYVFFAFWGTEVFSLLFGEQWRQAGDFFTLLAPVGFMMLLTNWSGRVYEVANRQSLSLALQFFFNALFVGIILVALSGGVTVSMYITAYAASITLFHFAYLAGIFVLMSLPITKYFRLTVLIISIVAAVWAVLWLGEYWFGRTLTAFGFGLILLLSFYALIALIFYKKRKNDQ